MSETMIVFGEGNTARRVLGYAGMGSTLLVIGGLGYAATEMHKSYQLDGRKERIGALIEKNDFPAASKILSSLDKKGMLRLEDKAMLELRVERAKGEYQFSSLINAGRIDDAKKLFMELKRKRVHHPTKLKKFNELLSGYTEQNLYTRMITASSIGRKKVAEQYLRFHKNGPHREEAVTYLLVGSLDHIVNLAKDKSPFSTVYSTLKRTNSLLRNYQGEGVQLSNVLPSSGLSKSLKRYVDQGGVSKKIGVGSLVTVIAKAEEGKNWRSEYHTERQNTVPTGSQGKVVGIQGGQIHVRFPNITSYYWKTKWQNTSDYWVGEKKNVASYYAHELASFRTLTPSEKAFLHQEIKKMEGLLKKYK